ncbi:MAG TPA: hypothetical protein VGD71_12505 [Kribbella sp.]|jgi:hypothetical protein
MIPTMILMGAAIAILWASVNRRTRPMVFFQLLIAAAVVFALLAVAAGSSVPYYLASAGLALVNEIAGAIPVILIALTIQRRRARAKEAGS